MSYVGLRAKTGIFEYRRVIPENGFRRDAMPAGLFLTDIYHRTDEEKYRQAAEYMRRHLAVLHPWGH
jgi:rhamnogalacturonyl hydrolase YesR